MSEEPTAFQVKVLASICQGIHSIFNEHLLCDLRVSVGGRTFDCHRLVLAAVSGFFQSLVSSTWRESQSGTVKIEHEDVTPESFQMLLDILYKTEDVINKATAKDILKMAIFLQVKFLEEHCVIFLNDKITPDVCVGTWMFAEKYQLPELAQTASAMSSDMIDQVVQGDEILHLPKAMLLVILGSQKKLTMDDLCRTVLRWVEHDADVRQVFFSELLPFVSFPQLSPVYISELMNYFFDHPFRKYLAKHIQDAVSFNLVNQQAQLQRQILAQQDRVAASPLIHKCAVIVGGYTDKDLEVLELSAIRADMAGGKCFSLKPPIQACGFHFASCVWKNELYTTQGSKEGTHLTKYLAGINDWEKLPYFEHGVERHAMAACNDRLYVIGGSAVLRKKPSPAIRVYHVGKKTWSKLKSELPLAVEDASAAVLGHRIYVFGGRDAAKKPLDAVQCVDTRTGRVYVAGSLPLPCGEVVARSDGGTIYVTCDGSRVLRMQERYDIADLKERKTKDVAPLGKDSAATSSDVATFSDVYSDVMTSASVSFMDVGAFTDIKVMSAFLHNGELMTCGGLSADGVLMPDIRGMNLKSGDVSKKALALPKVLKGFELQTLNIPKEFLV